jgi:GT2 family glycosyltransferase
MPASPPGPVYLVTILYNSADTLPSFLDCLLAQDIQDWRLIAIDNRSPDASLAMLEQCSDPRIAIVRNRANLGFATAANQGLRAAAAAGGRMFVLVNNDTGFTPDFLRRFVAEWNRLDALVITPRIMRRDRPEEAWYAGGHVDDGWDFHNVHEPYAPDAPAAPRAVGFASGCWLGLRREALERIGLLDESFFVYWEDTDFCMRLTAAGIPILYISEPSLLHDGGKASGGEFSLGHIRLYYRGYMQILRKHFGLGRAARTMLRLLLKQHGRAPRDRRVLRVMALAMLRGMLAPLSPPPRLAAKSLYD